MKYLKLVLAAVVIAAALVAWFAPIGPLPGIFIGGTDTPQPSAWGDTGDVDEIRLEVPGGLLPRVVIIWVVQVDGALHVVGAANSGWTTAIGESAPVRLRMGNSTYAMQATRVTEGWERILEAYVEKYRADYPDIVAGFPSIEEAAGTIAVFRLD